ncbi:Hsp20 family protein [Candidatus Gromoviella agglomerans]|uniref:Hsp20 family protein n=1 Tax=Candidatus Gromoviella agglomerans TaxID=2806609 RepID=UPI001E65BA1F|nr:Hsp20 family protein [Candidatus Gromoviella agglomerans]UFX98598.1 Small heat shock protein IbpB [Candidatus Gromoviella agglomerans]
MYTKYDSFDNENKRLLYSLEESSFPPYDIEKLQSDLVDKEYYRVSLAVAGVKKEDLQVYIQGTYLIVKAVARKEVDRIFLHKGISSKGFEKIFQLSESMVVRHSFFRDGLLCVDVIRNLSRQNIKAIPIISESDLLKLE